MNQRKLIRARGAHSAGILAAACSAAAYLVAACVAAGFVPVSASAESCTAATFECRQPAFPVEAAAPAYSDYESSLSPAAYEPDHGDYRAEFKSPRGKLVRIVVKAPVTTQVYDVPPIGAGETVNDYLNNALYASPNTPRQATVINFPKGTYDFDFPLFSNCTPAGGSPQYVHWQVAGASDLVIDGHGSTVNFADFCLGMNLANVNRVVLRNFTFSWPHIKIASLGTVIAVGGNGDTGYTYDVSIAGEDAAHLPNLLSAATAWDKDHDYWSLTHPNDDISYGDGIDSGVPLTCEPPAADRAAGGCTMRAIPSYGVKLSVGETLLMHYYSFGTGIGLTGNDITFDNVKFQNLIGSNFQFTQGRGFRATHVILTRTPGGLISGGGGSPFVNVSGDVVFDHCTIAYQSDDAFDMNTTIVRFTPGPVVNDTPMNTFTFDASAPAQLTWPGGSVAQAGDVIGLFDNGLVFRGTAKIVAVSIPANGGTQTLTLDRAVSAALGQAGFIAGDLSSSAGARYLFDDNTFAFNRARALLLQTPYGLVTGNHFVGQTMKQVYALASQFWGEGPGAQELSLRGNRFEAAGHAYESGFFAVDVLAEAANFPNLQDEVAGDGVAAPPINQHIVISDNTFKTDRPQALVNLSSVDHVVMFGNRFELTGAGSGPRQYPVTVHDASNVAFEATTSYVAGLPGVSCTDSIMNLLSDPPPVITPFAPVACTVAATTSGLIDRTH